MKNYFVSILLSFVIAMTFLLFFNEILYARNESENIKQQIWKFMGNELIKVDLSDETSILCQDPESFFMASIKQMLIRNNTKDLKVCYDDNGSDLVVIEKGEPFSNKDYKVLFGNNKDREEFKCTVANSICNFYGISRKELLHLRRQKVVIDKTKKEINKLFDESLDIINKYGNEQRIDEARLAKLIADELIKKQNEPLAPDTQMPTVPTLL